MSIARCSRAALCAAGLIGLCLQGCMSGSGSSENAMKHDSGMHNSTQGEMQSGMKMSDRQSTAWERLGGEQNVRRVVDDFVGRAASDPKVNFFRKGVEGAHEWKPGDKEVAHLKEMLVGLISSGTGGPLAYAGRDMKSVHHGMRITQGEFDALAGDLDGALRAGGASDADRMAVMSFAASTAKDIVERP